MLENILNDLFQIFRYDNFENIREALDILLLAMERHIGQKHIQISGSASLYYVAKSEALKRDLNLRMKRKILRTLLNGMLAHRDDPTMMRNGCLTLCQFQIPQAVLSLRMCLLFLFTSGPSVKFHVRIRHNGKQIGEAFLWAYWVWYRIIGTEGEMYRSKHILRMCNCIYRTVLVSKDYPGYRTNSVNF
jgi:hypothetical protein